MQKLLLSLILTLLASQINIAQSPTLVQDYVGGVEGSIDGRIYNFQNTLTYEGFTEFGEPVILQYDKTTDLVSVLATSQDFDGEISSISSNSLEMVVFTRDGAAGEPNKTLYRAYENDFSDIIKLYNSGDADLVTFRFHQDHYLIAEEYGQDDQEITNFKVVSPDGSVEDFLLGLNGSVFDFRFTAINGHFIVIPEEEYIDGKSVLVYNIESKTEVPITDIIPDFQDCGLISRFGSINNNIIYYDCEGTFIYNLSNSEYINTQNLSYFIMYENPEFLYISFNGGIYKLVKSTGQLEIIKDDIVSFRSYISNIVFTTFGLNGLEISILNFETDETYTYPTDLPTDVNVRFTGFGAVPEGLHFVLYESQEDNGIIASINEDSYTVIDSVYNVNFTNRPVAYGEDIYFTHQDSNVGNELFIIDYDISSLNELANKEIISVSPNPVIDYLQISHESDSKPSSIQIIDQNGRIVKIGPYQSILNVSQLNTGLYFLKATYNEGKVGITRFVKN